MSESSAADDAQDHIKAGFAGGIERVSAGQWDALAGNHDPFVSHAFLQAMEQSGSAGSRTGWQPLHFTLEQAGELIAAAPLYGKSNSWGEYVFDHSWADAYERAGGRYYPKLQVAVPFSPVPGNRLLARDLGAKAALAEALKSQLEVTNASSLHITFCSEAEASLLASHGYGIRRGIQYHWTNGGYGDFDDFLASLRSSKRKMINKERRAVTEAGVTMATLQGRAAVEPILDEFYPFYLATVDKRWGSAYLTKAFFKLLARTLGDKVVMVVAKAEGRIVAAALNLVGQETIYGRLWGCLDDYKFLHFEACYYAAIDYAITHGLKRVEAGAQGTHKLQRGYRPSWTYSAHHFREPQFQTAVQRFLDAETAELQQHFSDLESHLPYRAA